MSLDMAIPSQGRLRDYARRENTTSEQTTEDTPVPRKYSYDEQRAQGKAIDTIQRDIGRTQETLDHLRAKLDARKKDNKVTSGTERRIAELEAHRQEQRGQLQFLYENLGQQNYDDAVRAAPQNYRTDQLNKGNYNSGEEPNRIARAGSGYTGVKGGPNDPRVQTINGRQVFVTVRPVSGAEQADREKLREVLQRPGTARFQSTEYQKKYGEVFTTTYEAGDVQTPQGTVTIRRPTGTDTQGRPTYPNQNGRTADGRPVFNPPKKTVAIDLFNPQNREAIKANTAEYKNADDIFKNAQTNPKENELSDKSDTGINRNSYGLGSAKPNSSVKSQGNIKYNSSSSGDNDSREMDFERAVEKQSTREESYRKDLELPTERLSSYLTFGGGRPSSERGFFAATSQEVVSGGLLLFPSLGKGLVSSGEKAYLTGQAISIPSTRPNVLPELKRAAIQAPKEIVSSFDPTSPKGAANIILTTASVAGPKVVRSVAATGDSIFLTSKYRGSNALELLGERRIANPPGKALSVDVVVRPVEKDVFVVSQQEIGGGVRVTTVRGNRVLGEPQTIPGSELTKLDDTFIARAKGNVETRVVPTSDYLEAGGGVRTEPSTKVGLNARQEVDTRGVTTARKIFNNAPTEPRTRVERSLSPRGSTVYRAGNFEVTYEGVQLSGERSIVPTTKAKPARNDASGLRSTPEQVRTSYQPPKEVETLRSFSPERGDFSSINPTTGDFALVRFTEARRLGRGLRNQPGRPTLSTGRLPESANTQTNLPRELAQDFLKTQRAKEIYPQLRRPVQKPLIVEKVVVKKKPAVDGIEQDMGNGQVVILAPQVTEKVSTTVSTRAATSGMSSQQTTQQETSQESVIRKQKQAFVRRQNVFGQNQFSGVSSASLQGGRFKTGFAKTQRSKSATLPSQSRRQVFSFDTPRKPAQPSKVTPAFLPAQIAGSELAKMPAQSTSPALDTLRPPNNDFFPRGPRTPNNPTSRPPRFDIDLPSGSSSRQRSFKQKKAKYGYSASFTAAAFGITGKPTRLGTSSGLGIRPIISSTKKKRRTR